MPDVNAPNTIMAFDFGTQKMGMAVGQSLIESANPPFISHERWDPELG